jgi:hypothetical protein
MIYQNFSKRQLLTLTWWNKPQFMDCDGIICDGSIRSGKTVSMTDGFILWSMSRFNGQNFAICGKTIESLRRNVITLMPQWLEGIFSITERRSENKLIITSGGVTNSYYMFGGKDESSYTLVQGITLAGVLFDEVALMPRSFVEQAMARCSVVQLQPRKPRSLVLCGMDQESARAEHPVSALHDERQSEPCPGDQGQI